MNYARIKIEIQGLECFFDNILTKSRIKRFYILIASDKVRERNLMKSQDNNLSSFSV